MLSTLLLVVCIASILVAQLFILRSALGSTVVPHESALLPQPRRAADVAWAVLPAIALVFVLWVTWRETRAVMSPPPDMHEHAGHGAHSS